MKFPMNKKMLSLMKMIQTTMVMVSWMGLKTMMKMVCPMTKMKMTMVTDLGIDEKDEEDNDEL